MTPGIRLALTIGLALLFILWIYLIVLRVKHHREHYYLLFSEISQIKRDLGDRVGPIQLYYNMINDVSMKVFEANNISLERNGRFASELEVHIERTFKSHKHNLPDLLTNMAPVVDAALAELKDFITVMNQTGAAGSLLANTWDSDHQDVYHTEVYTVQVASTDSKGNTTYSTETRTRQVYDYTVHTYNVNHGAGNQAANVIDALTAVIPGITPPETLVSASKTGAEGEYAAQKSMSTKNKDATYEQAVGLIQSFHTRAVYSSVAPAVSRAYPEIAASCPGFRSSLLTARSTSYRTFSHFDSGPAEFQTWERYCGTVSGVNGAIHRFIDPMAAAGSRAVPYLELMNRYIKVVMEGAKGSESDLMFQILGEAEGHQKANFVGGPGIHRGNGWFHFFTVVLILLALAGSVVPIAYMWREEMGIGS